jgi:hypothetical protein
MKRIRLHTAVVALGLAGRMLGLAATSSGFGDLSSPRWRWRESDEKDPAAQHRWCALASAASRRDVRDRRCHHVGGCHQSATCVGSGVRACRGSPPGRTGAGGWHHAVAPDAGWFGPAQVAQRRAEAELAARQATAIAPRGARGEAAHTRHSPQIRNHFLV